MIRMIRDECQFSGGPGEDPNEHMLNFELITSTLHDQRVPADSIKLLLFEFSLSGKARQWLNELPAGSIRTWAECCTEFFRKYLPPSRVAQQMAEITRFKQDEDGSLGDTWRKFNQLIRRCPNHGEPLHKLLHYFYIALDRETAYELDMLAGGNFMGLRTQDAQELLNNVAKRETTRSETRRYSKTGETLLVGKMESMEQRLEKKMEAMVAAMMGKSPLAATKSIGEMLADETQGYNAHVEDVNFVRQQWPSTYHPNNRNHPNLSYNNPNGGLYAPGQQPKAPFQSQYQAPPPPIQQAPPQQDQDLIALMMKMNDNIERQQVQIMEQTKKLAAVEAKLNTHEMLIGEIAKQGAQQIAGTPPSNIIGHNEHVHAITTRSGASTIDPPYPSHARVEKTKAKEIELDEEIPVPTVRPQSKDTVRKSDEKKRPREDISLGVPYPQRLKGLDEEKHFKKFVDIFKKLHINIPFAEAISQMPKYAKFLKELLSNRKRMDDFATVVLTEECNAVVQRELPKKMKDPGGFIVPVTVGDAFHGNALCDLGASINLMPTSVFEKLGVGDPRPTAMRLQMADRSIKRPRGVLEDVLVRVDGLIFPADFVVLDMEADENVPLILGRPFLATGKAQIDVAKGELSMRIEDEKVTFNVFEPIRFPCYGIEEKKKKAPKAKPQPKQGGVHPVCQKLEAMKKEEARRAKPP